MMINFRGWRRQVHSHDHEVKTVEKTPRGGFRAVPGPLVWKDAKTVYGKIGDLALSGDFLVRMEFDEGELRNWMEVFVEQYPEEAIKMLTELQGNAILALHKKPHSDEAVSDD